MTARQARSLANRNRLVSTTVALALGAVVLTGCGDDEPSTDAGPSPTASPSASQTPSASQSTSPSADPSVPSQSASPVPDPLPPRTELRQRLLSPAALPGFNEEWAWRGEGTRPAGTEPFGTCAKFDLLSIGAREGFERTYSERGAADSTTKAAQQVYEFADAKTVARATAVLRSWHESCGQRTSADVGPIKSVDLSKGTGSWYLVTTPGGARDEGHFHAFGVASVGARMSLITMDNDGQDRIYEPGQDPMELAVAAAAARLS